MELELTKTIKRELFKYTHANKQGMYGCYEVTLGGGYGNQRVDFMTMDCYDTFRCYEIKISNNDLNSKCKLSFVGDYNYLVLTEDLYDYLVKEEKLYPYTCSGHIGIITFNQQYNQFTVKVKCKKSIVQLSKKVELMHDMIRSLSRFTKGEQ